MNVNELLDLLGDLQTRSTIYRLDHDEPKNAKLFPSSCVGDILYEFDIENGLVEYRIVSKRKDGACIVAPQIVGEIDKLQTQWHMPKWATKEFFTSESQAVVFAAKADLKYHTPRLRIASAALKAATNGEDLSRFAGGFDIEDDGG